MVTLCPQLPGEALRSCQPVPKGHCQTSAASVLGYFWHVSSTFPRSPGNLNIRFFNFRLDSLVWTRPGTSCDLSSSGPAALLPAVRARPRAPWQTAAFLTFFPNLDQPDCSWSCTAKDRRGWSGQMERRCVAGQRSGGAPPSCFPRRGKASLLGIFPFRRRREERVGRARPEGGGAGPSNWSGGSARPLTWGCCPLLGGRSQAGWYRSPLRAGSGRSRSSLRVVNGYAGGAVH